VQNERMPKGKKSGLDIRRRRGRREEGQAKF